MKIMKKFILLGMACSFLLMPLMAMADSISPSTFSASLDVGESVTITKTVTVDELPPVAAPVDVFFLADSTGSMGGEIAAVKSSMASIMGSTSGLGDVNFGVGEYKDIYDTFTYRLDTAVTGDTAAVQAGIDAVHASGGGDWAEANLYALNEVANSAATGWRAGSTRLLVWFGDAPGHDPRAGVDLATATASLTGANIAVQAIDVGYLDSYGQASSIASATGGAYYSGINSSTIVTTITDAISTAIDTYSSVAIDASGAPAGVTVTTDPAQIGSWDRSIARDFTFDVTFTGDTAGSYAFNINALVDGGVVATEYDNINVGGAPVPEPATMILLATGLLGLAGLKKRNKLI